MIIISSIYNWWDSFFHERTGIQGCRIAGYMRIGYALVFLIDRIVMIFNLDFFFSPDHGVLPYRVSRRNYELVDWNQRSIFQLYPESMEFVWIVALIGILQGVIVLLGATKYLRFHLFGIYLSIMSFQNQNALMWDGEDNMFRMWVIILLFFPLDHCTIYDGFGFGSSSVSSSSLSSSWPMWVFRIFQIEMVIIYMGASLGKLAVTEWQEGSAIYHLTYGIEDYPGIFNPDFLFARYGPLKLLCWSALVFEATCYITVWIPALRKLSVVIMIFFHIGIDLSMNMHMFEWLSCLGWCVFLIQPAPTLGAEAKAVETKPSSDKEVIRTKISFLSFCKKALTNVFVASFIIMISLDSLPYEDVTPFFSEAFRPAWSRIVEKRQTFFQWTIDPYITPIGLSQQGDWGMYSNVFVDLIELRIDALLANGTQVDNIWRSPNWFEMSSWERKFNSRKSNYYSALDESQGELLHLVELVTKSFFEQGNVVETLSVVAEYRTHKDHKMESTGGFWDPVVKHPMDVDSEKTILDLRVGDCEDALPTDTCARSMKEHGCKSLVEQCPKSCLTDCNGSNFVVEYWNMDDEN